MNSQILRNSSPAVLFRYPCNNVCLSTPRFPVHNLMYTARERWLLKTFPKFSSRSRNNKEPAPPSHTIQTRGTCNVKIGPHVFLDTVFYEVHYLPPQGYQPSSFSNQPQAANPYWQSTSYTTHSAASGNGNQESSLDSLPASIALTPKLIQQVNSAASSNPILANLLQLAAAGNATQDQLKTLGLLIQSFASLSSASSGQVQPCQPTTPSYSSSGFSTHPPVKEFDLVFEFRETPNDRWYIPRVPVYFERKPSPDVADELDITLLTCVPFLINKEPPLAGKEGENSLQYPVVFTLKNAPYMVWDTIWRWVGGESKNMANKAHIDKQVSNTASDPGVLSSLRIGTTSAALSRTSVDTRSIANTVTGGMHVSSQTA